MANRPASPVNSLSFGLYNHYHGAFWYSQGGFSQVVTQFRLVIGLNIRGVNIEIFRRLHVAGHSPSL
jgi:hypothetical protein